MTFKQKESNKQIDWNWVIESNESIRWLFQKKRMQKIDENQYKREKKKQAVPPGSHSMGTCLVFYRKENNINTNRASPKGNLFFFLPHLSVLQNIYSVLRH